MTILIKALVLSTLFIGAVSHYANAETCTDIAFRLNENILKDIKTVTKRSSKLPESFSLKDFQKAKAQYENTLEIIKDLEKILSMAANVDFENTVKFMVQLQQKYHQDKKNTYKLIHNIYKVHSNYHNISDFSLLYMAIIEAELSKAHAKSHKDHEEWQRKLKSYSKDVHNDTFAIRFSNPHYGNRNRYLFAFGQVDRLSSEKRALKKLYNSITDDIARKENGKYDLCIQFNL